MKPVNRKLNIWETCISYVEGFEDETVCVYKYELGLLMVSDCETLCSNS